MGETRRSDRSVRIKANRTSAAALAISAVALSVAACGGGAAPATTSAPEATSTTVAATTSTVPPPTTTTIPEALLAGSWNRIEHTEAVFGTDAFVVLRAVTSGGPGLVAVGEAGAGNEWDAAAWNSADGGTWFRIPGDDSALGGDQVQVMWSVASNGSSVAAVGWDGSYEDAEAAAWLSTDGVEWSRLPHDTYVLGGAGDQVMRAVAAGAQGYVAVGWDGSGDDRDAAVWTSEGGWIWSRVADADDVFGGDGDQGMYAVAGGGPGYVAVGWDASGDDLDGAVWTSPNGASWTRVEQDEAALGGAGDQGMYAVAAGGPGLVAVGWEGPAGESDAAVWTSPDGLAWTRVGREDDAFAGEGAQAMYAVAAGGPGFVAVGDSQANGDSDAAVWVSTDGVTWARLPESEGPFAGEGDQSMYGVTAHGSRVIAVGYDGSDGVIWVWIPG